MQNIRLMNAAGWCKYADGPEFEDLLNSAATDITMGAITWNPREGNHTDKGDIFWTDDLSGDGLNSLGMQNPGAEYYKEHLPEMVKRTHDRGKHLRVNIAGFSPPEYANLACYAMESGVDEIEVNLGCPNVWNDSKQKPIVSFDLFGMARILDDITDAVGDTAPVVLKLSPYSNPVQLTEIIKLISSRPLVKGVVTSNTFANAIDFTDDGKPIIGVGDGLAGLSGAAMLRINLGQTFQFRQQLPTRIKVFGVGGIRTGRDMWKYINCAGADGIQVGTELFKRKMPGACRIFDDILQEYFDIVSVA